MRENVRPRGFWASTGSHVVSAHAYIDTRPRGGSPAASEADGEVQQQS